jgi:hypothetical protein
VNLPNKSPEHLTAVGVSRLRDSAVAVLAASWRWLSFLRRLTFGRIVNDALIEALLALIGRAIAFKRNGRAVAVFSPTAADADYELAGIICILTLPCPPPRRGAGGNGRGRLRWGVFEEQPFSTGARQSNLLCPPRLPQSH